MTKIDTSGWGEFRIGDMFDVSYGKFIAKKEADENANIPHITASGVNNGISYNVSEAMFPANCLTVASDGAIGATYYQDTPFSASNIVSVLVPHTGIDLSKYVALFICTAIKAASRKYSWGGFKFSVDRVRNTTILLPQTPDHTPDFDYMENYMKEITKLAAKRVEKLKEEKTKYKIDTKGWGKFRVGDLFTVYLGDYNNPKFLTEDENGIPLVSATAINNGISGYYKKMPDLKVITKNKITWGKQCPYFYYQTTDFITGQGTYYLDVSALSFYTSLFICAVLNNEISQKYDYNNCLIGKKLSEEIILLPITTKGSPDWQFMEDYMKNIMEQAKKKFSDIPQ